MKEYTFDRSIEAEARPGQPHFDDERTLLSARPVVPLEKINARLRHRRNLFLGGAFALAMMLGAASALLASYLKLRNVSGDAQEISQLDDAPAPVAPVAVVEPVSESLEEGDVAPVENDENLETPVAPKVEPAIRPRPEARKNVTLTEPGPVRGSSEEEELDRIRDAVLFDRWQEQRARRATRLERRSRLDRDNHRDLSNLDEIFEGAKRP